MINRRKMHLLLPLLALSLALPMAASGATSASLQINFGTAPRWQSVEGTRVMAIRQGDRTNYDMFRYGRYYYAYNNENGRWYVSRKWRGRFTLINNRSVPSELRRIPRQHWRNYPSAWEDRRYQGQDGTSASLQINFGSTPHWMGISGTRVEMIPMAERPGYDVFRYGGTYYAYNNDRWYTSNRESGNFTVIDARSVPSEFSKVPREHWRRYPSAWQNQNQKGTPPGQMKMKGNSGSKGQGR